MAPLLLIASLCIVAGSANGATPPHRFALHRRRRGHQATATGSSTRALSSSANRTTMLRAGVGAVSGYSARW
jgi:hypothetical protein